MTNEEIFKQAVGKAIERGWLCESIREYEIIKVYTRFFGIDETDILYMTVHFNKYPVSEEINEKGYCWHYRCTYSLSDLLFSHDFMRALCGEKCAVDVKHCKIATCENCSGFFPFYLFHMRLLVELETDDQRLEYVRDNILEGT